MIGLIIFSKNRPMQLDCLLRSIKKNCDIFNYTTVIYKAGSNYTQGYDIVKEQHRGMYWTERDLLGDVWVIANNMPGRIAFMCDDDIIYRPFDGEVTGDCYSLRLGKNITEGAEVHFKYPMSLDGHIFNTEKLLQALSAINTPIKTPNDLEVALHRSRHLFPVINHADQSCLVGLPLNKVSTNSNCWHMGVSELELNERFLKGERIDFGNMDFSKVNNVHIRTGEVMFVNILE